PRRPSAAPPAGEAEEEWAAARLLDRSAPAARPAPETPRATRARRAPRARFPRGGRGAGAEGADRSSRTQPATGPEPLLACYFRYSQLQVVGGIPTVDLRSFRIPESPTDVMRTVSRCCYARPGRQRSQKGGRRHDIRGMRPAHAHAAGGRAGHGDWGDQRAPTPTRRDGGGRILCRLAPAGND